MKCFERIIIEIDLKVDRLDVRQSGYSILIATKQTELRPLSTLLFLISKFRYTNNYLNDII